MSIMLDAVYGDFDFCVTLTDGTMLVCGKASYAAPFYHLEPPRKRAGKIRDLLQVMPNARDHVVVNLSRGIDIHANSISAVQKIPQPVRVIA